MKSMSFLLILMLSFSFSVLATTFQSLEFKVGEEKVRKLKGLKTIAIANPSILSVKVVKNKIQLKALERGQTKVILWFKHKAKEIWVIDVDSNNYMQSIKKQERAKKQKRHKKSKDLILAEKFFKQKKYVKSFKFTQKALEHEAGYNAAVRLLDRLEGVAANAYLRAYQKERKKPQSAIKDYQLILKITLNTNSIHKKARKRLNKLLK